MNPFDPSHPPAADRQCTVRWLLLLAVLLAAAGALGWGWLALVR